MVRACPGVRVLATSREGLGVGGERLMVVRSLGGPRRDAGRRAARWSATRSGCSSIAPTAARHGFVLDARQRDAIAQICRRLDGIPLAIELAAARTRMMTPRRSLVGSTNGSGSSPAGTAPRWNATRRCASGRLVLCLLDPERAVAPRPPRGIRRGVHSRRRRSGAPVTWSRGRRRARCVGSARRQVARCRRRSIDVARAVPAPRNDPPVRARTTRRDRRNRHRPPPPRRALPSRTRRRSWPHYVDQRRIAAHGRPGDREPASCLRLGGCAVGDADIALGLAVALGGFGTPDPGTGSLDGLRPPSTCPPGGAILSAPMPRTWIAQGKFLISGSLDTLTDRIQVIDAAHDEAGIELLPNAHMAHANHTTLCGQMDEAIHHYTTAVHLGPRNRRPETSESLEWPVRPVPRQPGLQRACDRACRAVRVPSPPKPDAGRYSRKARWESRQRRGSREGDPSPRKHLGTRARRRQRSPDADVRNLAGQSARGQRRQLTDALNYSLILLDNAIANPAIPCSRPLPATP